MKRQLQELYGKHKENVPEEVVSFLRRLHQDFKPRCIRLGETPEEAHRYAGLSERVSDAIQWLDT
jgi:hypothetical protein